MTHEVQGTNPHHFLYVTGVSFLFRSQTPHPTPGLWEVTQELLAQQMTGPGNLGKGGKRSGEMGGWTR